MKMKMEKTKEVRKTNKITPRVHPANTDCAFRRGESINNLDHVPFSVDAQ